MFPTVSGPAVTYSDIHGTVNYIRCVELSAEVSVNIFGYALWRIKIDFGPFAFKTGRGLSSLLIPLHIGT